MVGQGFIIGHSVHVYIIFLQILFYINTCMLSKLSIIMTLFVFLQYNSILFKHTPLISLAVTINCVSQFNIMCIYIHIICIYYNNIQYKILYNYDYIISLL